MQISLPPDQKFIIIHLSDMHLWHGRPNAVMNRTEALAAAISSLQPLSERKFLIVFSGDIAFSGSKSEYEMAGSFFSDLASYLDQMGISEFETFIVPGNHDCDFSLNNKAREILLGEIYKGVEIDEAVINICVSVQQNFFDFKRSLFSEIEQDWHPLLWRGSIDVFGFKVVINGFNTSWVSKRHEDYGKLYMPANTLGVEATSADLVISVFHHPYSWLPVENKNEYKSLVERSSDFSFTGHEHVGESLSVSSGGERLQNYIIAGALQENHDQSVSEFNAVVFDITTMQYMSYHFLYEDNKYNLNQVDGDWQEYRSSSRKLPNSFQLNKQYIQQTNDNGYALSNGERRLFVDDLFIFPNLREIVPKDQIKKIDPKLGKSDSHILLGKNIIDWINRTERAIIYGPDRSGKTTLARKIQAEMLSDKLVPLVLDCDQIGRYTKDTPEKIIKAAIAQQFGPEVHEEFMQLGINNRIILIDNFSSNNLNDHARDDLISQVNNFSKRVLVFSSDDISVDSIAIIKIVSSLKEYKRIEILPFGHNLRSELVRKWYAPTDPYSVNIDDLEKKCVAVERLITAMAANNLAVTYPLQVLVMLQNVESSAGSDISSSSYASFCEVQIKTELNKISQSYGFDQGTLHSILEEVAYEMHKSGIRSYSIAEYLEQLEKYSSLYFLPAKPADVLDAARAVGILSAQ